MEFILNEKGYYTLTQITEADNKIVQIPSKYEGKKVTAIAPFAFKGSMTEKVILPNTLRVIHDYAFAGCETLESISFDCFNNIETIEEYAFMGTKIKKFTIGANCTNVSKFAFNEARNLEKIKVIEGNKKYESIDGILIDKHINAVLKCPEGKQGEFKVPDEITIISEKAFEYSLLEKIKFNKELLFIENKAFRQCKNLNAIMLPRGIKDIGVSAFENCSSLEQIFIPDALEKIPMKCFKNCVNLKNISLGEKTKEIEFEAFFNCFELKTVNLENIKRINTRAFANCSSLEQLELNSCKYIAFSSFTKCENLKEINLPLVETLETRCFSNCTNLNKVYVNTRLFELPRKAFAKAFNISVFNIADIVIFGEKAIEEEVEQRIS